MQSRSMQNVTTGLSMCSVVAIALTALLLTSATARAQQPTKEVPSRSVEVRATGNPAVGETGIIEVPRVSGGDYRVAPDSKGNQLVLNITNPLEKSNGSGQPEMDSLMVWVVRPPQQPLWDLPVPKVHFKPEYLVIPYPDGENGIDASFTFDVDRDVRLNGRDTIEFLIVGREGPLMRKTLTLRYSLPTDFQLEQNFPNPFNPTTTIYYQLPADSRVTLKIYDILGREVKTLVEEQKSAGYYNVMWDATNSSGNKVSSGAYVYRIIATGMGSSGFNGLRKMILLK